MESPFLYFLGRPTGEKRGRFFNEILVPDFWEITGDASGGRISYYGQEKARIYYQGATHKRIVERVEWFNQEGQVRTVDRYDQYGRKIAVTSCDGQGNPLLTTYFEEEIERLTENHQTGDLLLTLDHEPMRIFKNRLDFYVFYVQYRGFALDQVLFNTLAQSFALSLQLGKMGLVGRDVLVW